MAKVNKRLGEIQKQITELERYEEELRRDEPEAYQQEKGEIRENLLKLRIEHLEHLIRVYERQNPGKYAEKKDALEAKLQYIKDGGDPKLWNYATWLKVQSAQKVESSVDVNKDVKVDPQIPATISEPEKTFKCEQCEFAAKNATGLAVHTKSKHKE